MVQSNPLDITMRSISRESSAMFRRIVLRSSAPRRIGLDHRAAPRLTNGQLTAQYRIEDNRMPRGSMSLARADVAHFLLREVERGEHVHKIVGLA